MSGDINTWVPLIQKDSGKEMESDKFLPEINKDTEFVPNGEKIEITRFLHDQADVEQLYSKAKSPAKTIKEKICSSFSCSGSAVLGYILSLFPIVGVIRNYKLKSYLLGDVLSGISSACLHFPQGLAFGILASLSPAHGLYTSFFPVICYIIFGTSQHISFGTNAVIALFTAEIVESQVQNQVFNASALSSGNISVSIEDTILQFKSATAAGASFFVGVILLAMGFFQLGFITSYMSSSFVSAFTTTSAVHIISSQIPKALGINIPLITGPGKLILTYVEIFKRILTANVGVVITSVICIIVLVIVKDFINERCKEKMKMPVPIDLILIIVATIISHFGRLSEQFRIPIVNDIPSGIPAPSIPRLSVEYLGNSFVVAIIVFVLTISMARVCEIKHDYQVNDNQELIAYGVSNFVSSFFSCFPSCTAPPRTMLMSALGAKTTLNGIFTALFILLVLFVVGPLFTSLPQAVLAIMVIMAVKNLLTQVRQLAVFWRINKFDLVIWIGTFVSGVFIDFPYALYIGVLLCLFTVVLQSQISKHHLLQRSKTEDLFLDSHKYNNTIELQGIKIFRMESSLYFATSELFRKRLYAATVDPRSVKRSNDVNLTVQPSDEKDESGLSSQIVTDDLASRKTNLETLNHIILDCSTMNYVDSNGLQALCRVVTEFELIGVPVLFANCSVCLLDVFEHATLPDNITKEHMFPTIFDAVRYALNAAA